MEYFVDKSSVVREIWGKGDTILFIFAGASAEFALSKAVDWLYFTGRLPADPLGRLFSTVSYARAIVFSEKQAALRAIDSMAAIHANVEEKRGATIPDWAYRDVLFMLIDYSIRAFEVMERRLKKDEKQEVFEVFYRVGKRMGLIGLPETFEEWETMRQEHINRNLQHSFYTDDLFSQYRKHLGFVRYSILLEAQTLVVPKKVRELLGHRSFSLLNPLLRLYKLSRSIKADWLLKALILPTRYKNEIKELDHLPTW
ncbi:oxygenase MpaB family protein [Gillisia sp. Q332]|uniref:oxygenase MpaB family protein n=1 Tax=Gillisia xinjiangensis TaxID=3384765 RepID=UPI00391B8E66